jgi:hypothetical protein
MAQLNMVTAFANLGIALGAGKSKELFLITRAAAAAQAYVQANLAYAQALASPPGPPWTIPLAETVRVTGYVNAAAIAAQAITGLKDGMTEVPGIGNHDQFPAMLAPGERVVDSDANADLKKAIGMILNGQGGGSGQIEVVISLKDDAVHFMETELIKRNRIGISSGQI